MNLLGVVESNVVRDIFNILDICIRLEKCLPFVFTFSSVQLLCYVRLSIASSAAYVVRAAF